MPATPSDLSPAPPLSGPMLAPLSGAAPKQLMVLLHGYGSDGADLIALGTHWAPAMPDTLFVAPNAPQDCPGSSGYQWFALDLERPISRMVGLPLARPVLEAFLQALWRQTGLSAAQTVLVGFSQGAMMALHVGLALDPPPLGIVAFSGALIAPDGFGLSDAALPHVCLVHGDEDTVVEPELSTQAAAALEQAGAVVSYHVSKGTGHGIAPDGLAYAGAFIKGLTPAS